MEISLFLSDTIRLLTLKMVDGNDYLEDNYDFDAESSERDITNKNMAMFIILKMEVVIMFLMIL